MIRKPENLSRAELINQLKILEKDLIKEKEAARIIRKVFVSRVNHEIRTPLNSIVGFANLLVNDKVDQSQRKLYVQYLNSSTESLLSRMENLIDYAMLTAGQLELLEEEVRIDHLFDEIYEAFNVEKHLQEKFGVALLLSRNKGYERIIANCDRRRLKQILGSLMKNALQGTRNGNIEFGYEPKGKKHLKFFVSDSADQYRTEYIQKLFENPEKLEKSKQDMDINLSVVRELVILMKGTIKVTLHRSGKGNTISFILPLKYNILPADKLSKREVKEDFPDKTEKSDDKPKQEQI